MADSTTPESTAKHVTKGDEVAKDAVPEVTAVPEAPEEWVEKAKGGSEEYQLKLGEHYLTLADSSEDGSDTGKLAVHWLSQASKQSNETATQQLKKCLETGTGITDENRDDVKWCVNTSSIEKKIRFAARNMFHSINSAHKDVLSPEEYSEAIKKMTGGKEQKLLLAAGKKIGEKISENEFVKILSRKVQGTMTLTSSERSDAYETAGVFEKIVKYPHETASAVGEQVLEYASRDGLGIVLSCVPVDQIYFLMLFFVYGFMSPKFLLIIVPLIVFYITFAVIMITTLQMFHKKRKLKEASALAEMLKGYDVGVDVDQTQSQYTWNSLTSYLIFFTALPMLVVSFALADKTYIPCSELTVLSAIFCGICFVAISDSHDMITLLALFCNFLAALPIFLHNFPEVPVLTSILRLVSGSFVTIDIYAGLKFNIGIPSVCYCIIPVFFIQMACRKSFQGMYRVLIPHMVCYFWFNLVVSFYPFATWFGLARATVGYVALPLLIPLSAFIFIIGFIYMIVKLSSSDLFGKVIITLLLACIPILLTQTKKLFGGKLDKNKKFGFIKKILMIVFATLSIIPLIFLRIPKGPEKVVSGLNLDRYLEICGPKGTANTAATQIKCGHLKGTKVLWTGVFHHATVASHTNDVGSMIDVFPGFIGNPLRCIYGEYYDCEEEGISESDAAYCKLMTSLGHECHVRQYDSYTFNSAVSVTGGNDETLKLSIDAGSGMKDTLVALEEGDVVEVRGTLVDGLGTGSPKLKLKGVKCKSRELMVMAVVEEDWDDFYINLYDQSLQVTVNFFWHPLMEYIPQGPQDDDTIVE